MRARTLREPTEILERTPAPVATAAQLRAAVHTVNPKVTVFPQSFTESTVFFTDWKLFSSSAFSSGLRSISRIFSTPPAPS